MNKRAILIHGPTASGKTALAIACAKQLHGEIINADAMQVYKNLQILTARPDKMQAVPHHLFGYKEASNPGSVGEWLDCAEKILNEIWQRNRLPIIVGGSGLYLSALTGGLLRMPENIPPETRAQARACVLDGKGYEKLRRLDPQAASHIHPSDGQRIARALEVFMATGKSLLLLQQQKQTPALTPGKWSGFVLFPPRQQLYARIDKRFINMMQKGALDEAQALKNLMLDPDLPIMKSHGLPPLLEYLHRRITLEEAQILACRHSRRYAKRQYTWISGPFQRWTRIPATQTEQECHTLIRIYEEDCANPSLTERR